MKRDSFDEALEASIVNGKPTWTTIGLLVGKIKWEINREIHLRSTRGD